MDAVSFLPCCSIPCSELFGCSIVHYILVHLHLLFGGGIYLSSFVTLLCYSSNRFNSLACPYSILGVSVYGPRNRFAHSDLLDASYPSSRINPFPSLLVSIDESSCHLMLDLAENPHSCAKLPHLGTSIVRHAMHNDRFLHQRALHGETSHNILSQSVP